MSREIQTLDASLVRKAHRRLVVRLLWSDGRISRADLARRTGLSRSTISGITSELLRTDLVRELGVGSSRGGRRPIVLGFNADARLAIGVDMGASHVAVALANLHGGVRVWRHRQHPVRRDPTGTIALVHRLIGDALAEEPESARRVIGIGLAVPSPVVPGEPNRLPSLILPDWVGHDIIAALEKGHGLPVFADNDANLGALAELRWGAGRGRENLAFVKLATGIGAGLIINGAVYHGSNGIAGELAHTSVDANGPECACGQRGCLVLLVGSEALIERARAEARTEPRSRLDDKTLSTDTLVDAALAGDLIAVETIAQAGERIGIGVANLINVVDPGLVVLGGELTRAGPILLDPIIETVRGRALSMFAARPEIVTTRLGDRDIALGAATQVIDAALKDDALLLGKPIAAAG
jgi:predicted NBD/HSP70 family sugar kinase